MKPLKFARLSLSDPVRRAVAECGYQSMTPIQSGAIPPLLEGKDLLGTAQTGTGKTAAFALPILERFHQDRQSAKPGRPLALVLAPTRELSAQISESFAQYGKYVRFRQAVIYGGVSQNRQVAALRKGVELVVATPGRLLDLMQQQEVFLDQLHTFVLDEADRMLDMGFLPDLRRIVAKLPKQRHSMFFTATMPRDAGDLASQLLRNPVTVSVDAPSSTVDKIVQRVMMVPFADKQRLLRTIVGDHSVGQALVFTRTKRTADAVARRLRKSGVDAEALHSNKSQNARTRIIGQFRDFEIQVLVATDLAARGIDIDGITHVINYDLPNETENYVHRIGRTGRAGADGVAISLCDPSERQALQQIEKLIGQRIKVDRKHPYHDDSPGFSKPRSNNRNGPRRKK